MDPRIQQIYQQRALMSGGCTAPGIFGGYSQGGSLGYLQGGAARKTTIKIHPGDKTVQVGNTLVVSHPASETKVKAVRKKKPRTLEQQAADAQKKVALAEKQLLALAIKQANKPIRAMYDVPDVITACDAASVQYATAMGKEVPKAVQRRIEHALKNPGMTYGPSVSPAQLKTLQAVALNDPAILSAQLKAQAQLKAAIEKQQEGEAITEALKELTTGTGLLGGARKRKVIVRPGRVVSVKCVKTKQYAAAKKKTAAKRVARKKAK